MKSERSICPFFKLASADKDTEKELEQLVLNFCLFTNTCTSITLSSGVVEMPCYRKPVLCDRCCTNRTTQRKTAIIRSCYGTQHGLSELVCLISEMRTFGFRYCRYENQEKHVNLGFLLTSVIHLPSQMIFLRSKFDPRHVSEMRLGSMHLGYQKFLFYAFRRNQKHCWFLELK